MGSGFYQNPVTFYEDDSRLKYAIANVIFNYLFDNINCQFVLCYNRWYSPFVNVVFEIKMHDLIDIFCIF